MAPLMAVLGAIIDQQQDARGADASASRFRNACVSSSIQCRSSKITISGWLRLSRSMIRLIASSERRLRVCASISAI